MLAPLWVIPVLPFVSFGVLALFGRRLPRAATSAIGVGSIGVCMSLSILAAISFIAWPPPNHVYVQTIWTWMSVGGLTPGISWYLDALAVVMVLVVSSVSFVIHLYSTGYMAEDEGYSRFFAYMNLFTGSMLTIVLAENLPLLYLGWEGVGLCSYLLIGFWYGDPANGRAARKAFVVTRVGDTAFFIGLLLLFANLGTLHIQPLMAAAQAHWPAGSFLPNAAAALLLGGAIGKSAQAPLQVWLPDAMAGPTPTSALIHAATMVTAGVYLIARMNGLYTLAPAVMLAVAVIGAVTLVLAGISAMTQSDIKRALAYSTVSQIGYMFLALGVGAWSAAIFHFMTHAFFKALLFMAAGVIIVGLREEHDMFRMGGLRRQAPLACWTFIVGAGALAGLPIVTAGFYSKGLILWQAWSSPQGSPWLWAAGVVGVLITAVYSFRMVFLTFFGQERQQMSRRAGLNMQAPLVLLAILSIIAGYVELPAWLGNQPFFTNFLRMALPPAAGEGSFTLQWILELIAALLAVGGVVLAYVLYLAQPGLVRAVVSTPVGAALHRFWFEDWGFDWLYERIAVRPYRWLASTDREDVIGLIYRLMGWIVTQLHRAFALTQTGRLRWYAASITVGAIVIVGVVVLA